MPSPPIVTPWNLNGSNWPTLNRASPRRRSNWLPHKRRSPVDGPRSTKRPDKSPGR